MKQFFRLVFRFQTCSDQLFGRLTVIIIIITLIKRISRAPIYHTRWQHRALYNNTTHTHTQHRNEGMGRAVKNSLEIIIKQVRLEGGFVYRVYASMHACND